MDIETFVKHVPLTQENLDRWQAEVTNNERNGTHAILSIGVTFKCDWCGKNLRPGYAHECTHGIADETYWDISERIRQEFEYIHTLLFILNGKYKELEG